MECEICGAKLLNGICPVASEQWHEAGDEDELLPMLDGGAGDSEAADEFDIT
jgi:hypothetical protein